MSDVFQTIGNVRADVRHEDLSVYEQTIRAGSRTIAIANIAHLEVGELSGNVFGKVVLFILAAGAGLGALASGLNGVMAGFVILAAISALLFWLLWMQKKEFIFIIATNDGSRTSFVGKNHKLLREACDYVTWKINTSDKAAKTYFNFNNNTISGSQIGGTIQNG